ADLGEALDGALADAMAGTVVRWRIEAGIGGDRGPVEQPQPPDIAVQSTLDPAEGKGARELLQVQVAQRDVRRERRPRTERRAERERLDLEPAVEDLCAQGATDAQLTVPVFHFRHASGDCAAEDRPAQ